MKVYETNLSFSGMSGHALVVEFGGHYRLLFWSKAQYAGCWDLGGDVWFCSEWIETNSPENHHCYEPIMDKKLKYSRVKVLEANQARTKVQWRYACNDLRYRIFHGNTFGEEVFTVYPDGIAVRNVTVYPGDESSFGGNPNFWQVLEWITMYGASTSPDAALRKDPAFVLMNDEGTSISLTWPIQFEEFQPLCQAFPQIRDWNMYIGEVQLVDRPKPFVVVAKDQRLFPYRSCSHCGGDHPYFTLFSRVGSIWRYPTDSEAFILSESGLPLIGKEAVSTSFIDGNYDMRPGGTDSQGRRSKAARYFVDTPPKGTTWLLLTGATEGGSRELLEIARSWSSPAEVVTGNECPSNFIPGGAAQIGPVIYEGYAYSERAYTFRKIGVPRVDFRLNVAGPVIHPVFTVCGWETGGVEVQIDDRPVDPAIVHSAIVADELVVFLDIRIDRSAKVSLVEKG